MLVLFFSITYLFNFHICIFCFITVCLKNGGTLKAWTYKTILTWNLLMSVCMKLSSVCVCVCVCVLNCVFLPLEGNLGGRIFLVLFNTEYSIDKLLLMKWVTRKILHICCLFFSSFGLLFRMLFLVFPAIISVGEVGFFLGFLFPT